MALKCAKYHEVTHLAIAATFAASFGGFNTPHACMLRSVAAILDRAPDEDWNVGREEDLCSCLIMMIVGESRHTLCLMCYASCVSIPLFESQDKRCSVEASHDPKARWMVIKGLEIQIPLAIVPSRRSRTKFKGPVEKLISRGKWKEFPTR